MSYNSTGNPPMLISPAGLAPANNIGTTGMAAGKALWYYNSTDTLSNVRTTGYFTDAQQLGMRNGDSIICALHTAEGSSGHNFTIGMVEGVSSNGANVSTAGMVSSTM